MTAILNRSSRNFLWRHPWQLALAILGIALGVAVVIAIDLAMESALKSFNHASKAYSGAATHRIIASDGGLDEKLYSQLRVEQGISHLNPVVSGYITLSQRKEDRFKLVGIDPFIEKSFHTGWQSGQTENFSPDLFMRLLAEANTVLISATAAQRLNLHPGDQLAVETGHGEHQLKIIGLIPGSNAVAGQALAKLMICDIATAQEVLGLAGRLSSIEAQLANEAGNTLKKIQSILPGNALLVSVESQEQAMRTMTRAFSINLQALGLLSLLVGMFLIYNTMTFLVLQRRRLIGSLRLLGVTRQQIFQLVMTEALSLAIVGTVIGIALGIMLGHSLLVLISGTLNDIYFKLDATTFTITPPQLGKGLLLGLGATFLAVLPPAFEATRVSPVKVLSRAQLESGSRRLINLMAFLSYLLIASGLALAFFSGQSIEMGLASIFLLLIGFGLLTPLLTLLLMKAMEGFFGRFIGLMARLPVRMVSAEISRTGIAIAALMIAVSATIGMDLMIGSFRQTVAQWLHTSLPADLYVSLPDDKMAAEKSVADHRLKEKIAGMADVDMLSSILHTKLIADGQLTKTSVFELTPKSRQGFIFKHKIDDGFWHRFETQQTLIVTEPFAYHQTIKLGQKIQLKTGQGLAGFEVIGISAEYSGDQGHLIMSRQNYQRYWPDLGYSGIGIYARAGADLTQLENRISQLLTPQQGVKSNQAIYTASMQLFEQTFTITETLRWLSAAIAFVGVFSALMALQFERTRQLGILRAIGITSRQLAALIIGETGLMGVVAGLLAIPAGFIVAYVLIFVVYQRSFGWAMAFYFDSIILYQGLALAFLAALLAGVFPSLKMAQTHPAEALRTE